MAKDKVYLIRVNSMKEFIKNRVLLDGLEYVAGVTELVSEDREAELKKWLDDYVSDLNIEFIDMPHGKADETINRMLVWVEGNNVIMFDEG